MDNDHGVRPDMSPSQPPAPPPPLIIKADELDSTGTDVSTPVPDAGTPITPALQAPPLDSPQSLSRQSLSSSPRPAAVRPVLRREGSTPAPPAQPPPAAPRQTQPSGQGEQQATDSLSLQQLRQLVTNLPKFEPQAYAYDHADTRSFAEEVEEWFPYSEEERYMLLRGREAFETRWERWRGARKWTEVEEEERAGFIESVVREIEKEAEAVEGVECLTYLAMGCWGETAGLKGDQPADQNQENAKQDQWGNMPSGQFLHSLVQIEWIKRGCDMLAGCGAVKCIFGVLRRACDGEQDAEQYADTVPLNDEEQSSVILHRFLVINQALTALFLIIEVGRWGPSERKTTIQHAIGDLKPNLLHYLTNVIAKTRWQESPRLPFTRIILLYWKVILLVFGTSADLKDSKKVLRDDSDATKDDSGEGFITASPLDYHLFRQELTSKYPAYNPPPPLLPIEPENNSILPPLPNHPSRRTSQENLTATNDPTISGTSGSIFVQPVHIATPAPSPPPSPAGPGGKGGKKQNYQTNQNFPFLYPPLDETSNITGGRGDLEPQHPLLSRRWEGNDVPASILEAGQLFASRMRMSRSIRQLWDVREEFIRHERGWDDVSKDNASNGSSGSMIEEDDDNGAEDDEEPTTILVGKPAEANQKETSDQDVQSRLDAIESFYRAALPHLQSVVLVLWKIMFTNVSYMAAQGNGTNGLSVPNGISFPEERPNTGPVKRKMNVRPTAQEGVVNGHPTEFDDGADPAIEELNSARSREISSKAISAILLMLLKWFKLSHILKYEYLTQLLLDANYLPLILKYFAHQDIDRAVDQKIDREDLNFFSFCHLNSNNPPPTSPNHPPSPSPSSPESAAPPPIPTHRRTRSTPSSSPPSPPLKPAVDELGYPTAPLPSSPLTTYSPRFFFTTTTLLRLLQKITKNHAHRSLLLVQYKSSTILRRHLKVPQPELRLYTLKLFKHQVPFCGRKWRQSNMRVITAVYLHVGMRLRDEWLAGGDVDGVVEEAVPVEQGWRALVHWWHLRGYRGCVEGTGREGGSGAGGRDRLDGRGEDSRERTEDVYDFFARELEKMGWGVGGTGAGDGVHGDREGEGEGDGEDEFPPGGPGGGATGDEGGSNSSSGSRVGGGNEWEGGPLQLEGWA
ncbi:MAG: hypothetical protein Q9219_001546 [cf. Caloplaca sp. 3 TL-2023]